MKVLVLSDREFRLVKEGLSNTVSELEGALDVKQEKKLLEQLQEPEEINEKVFDAKPGFHFEAIKRAVLGCEDAE